MKKNDDDRISRLVLSRRLGEAICIGDDIRIIVYKKENNTDQFKILIEAPRSIPIVREEIKGAPNDPKKHRGLSERFNARVDEIDQKLDRIEEILATFKKQEEALK